MSIYIYTLGKITTKYLIIYYYIFKDENNKIITPSSLKYKTTIKIIQFGHNYHDHFLIFFNFSPNYPCK